jgi:hypothetical protein
MQELVWTGGDDRSNVVSDSVRPGVAEPVPAELCGMPRFDAGAMIIGSSALDEQRKVASPGTWYGGTYC